MLKEVTRNILLNILIWFYNFNICNNLILKLISFFGGPIFIKIFQIFNNLNNLKYFHNEGTIGKIYFNGNYVMKKLKPNIYKNFQESLVIFKSFIFFYNYKFPFHYDEFYKYNLEQLDLQNEANNSYRLTNIFKNISNVNIIKIFKSTKNCHISQKIIAMDIQLLLSIYPKCKKKLTYLLHLSYLLMIVSNCFHCDWHFGNFLVKINNQNNLELYILDTGLVGKFDDKIYERIKSLILTDFLFPKRYNVIKFLLFCNLNKKADINSFINKTKTSDKCYNEDIRNIIRLAGQYNLKFPIMILYMFQGILFINNLCESNNISVRDLKDFAKKNNFYDEIKSYLK